MSDYFRFILDSVFSNRRRALITVAIIAVGVSALVGIQTALDVMADRVAGSFIRMGTGLCSIRPKVGATPLTRQQAEAFRDVWCSGKGVAEAAVWAEGADAVRVRGGGAVTDPVAAAAMEQLPNLKNTEVHSTVLLSQVDESTYKKLGANLTCDPVYQSKKLYHRG